MSSKKALTTSTEVPVDRACPLCGSEIELHITEAISSRYSIRWVKGKPKENDLLSTYRNWMWHHLICTNEECNWTIRIDLNMGKIFEL